MITTTNRPEITEPVTEMNYDAKSWKGAIPVIGYRPNCLTDCLSTDQAPRAAAYIFIRWQRAHFQLCSMPGEQNFYTMLKFCILVVFTLSF